MVCIIDSPLNDLVINYNIIVNVFTEEKVFSALSGESPQQTQAQQLFQFGKTKIFFRSGQVALLERIRSQKLKECAILLQRMIRGWLVRRRYIKIRFTIMRLQCYARAFLARRLYLHLRRTRAATRIQTKWRAWSARQKFLTLKRTAVGLQQYARGVIARRKFLKIKEHLASITIQRYWRGYVARKAYLKRIRRVIIVQSLIRRFLAKRQLKKLRIEARSVEHVTNLNKGLERKIIELQQKVDDMNNQRKALIQNENEISEYKSQFSRLEIEIKNLKNDLKQKDIQFQTLADEMNDSKNVNEKLVKDVERHKSKINELLSNNAKIRQENDPKLIEAAVKEKEKLLITKYEKEKKALIDERENERASRQQLLRKYMALEEKYQSGGRGEDDDDRSPDISTVSLMMRCSELEQECAKCKQENQEMRELIAASADFEDNDRGASLLAQQCAQMQIELDRYREERTNLKTIVLSQESNIKDVRFGFDLQIY
jgi:myosin-5